jgi:hypothetical protein
VSLTLLAASRSKIVPDDFVDHSSLSDESNVPPRSAGRLCILLMG